MGAVAKRVVLFLLVNLLVMLTLSIVLGIATLFFPALGQNGLPGIVFLGASSASAGPSSASSSASGPPSAAWASR